MKMKSMGKISSVLLLAAILIVPAAVCIIGEDTEAAEPDGYYYGKLSNYSKNAYKAMITDLEAGKSTFYIGDYENYGDSTETVGDYIVEAYFSILRDRPDLFWLGNKISVSGTTDDLKVEIKDGIESSKIDSMKASLNSSLASVPAITGTDFDKLKIIHDYVVSSTSYDKTLSKSNTRNIYGTFVEKSVVCEGYAKALKYLCDLNGIECILVSGTGTNSSGSEGHMWNYVNLSGKWYLVDPTWDDPLVNGVDSGKVYHTYFLVGSTTVVNDIVVSQSHILRSDDVLAKYVPVLSTSAHSSYPIDKPEVKPPSDDSSKPGTDPSPSDKPGTGSDDTPPSVPDVPDTPNPDDSNKDGEVKVYEIEDLDYPCSLGALYLTTLDNTVMKMDGNDVAVIEVRDIEFKMNKESLSLLASYIRNHPVTVSFDAKTELQAFKTFNVLNYERDVYIISIKINGNEITDLKIFGSKFEMDVSVPYEKSFGEFSFLMGAWNIDDEDSKRISASLEEDYVTFDLKETGSYIVGTNEFSNLSLTVIFIGIFVFLVLILLLLGAAKGGKKKK